MKRSGFRNTNSKVVTSIDIGSSKVLCMIAEYDPRANDPKILGMGHYALQGTKHALGSTLEEIETAILNAVHKAEKVAGLRVKEVALNISGTHLLSEVVKVAVDITGHAVDDLDIKRTLAQGMNHAPTKNFSILHINPIKFSIDGGKPIRNPKGMYGDKLMAYLHVVTGETNPIRNIVNCLKRCHINVTNVLPSAIASGIATLAEDEMDLGVLLMDIGSQYTNLALFMGGDVIHTECIPLGGMHITNDLAQGLGTSFAAAERIKLLHGNALGTHEDEKVIIDIPQVVNQQDLPPSQMPRSMITRIIRPRVEEIFEHAQTRLQKTSFHKIACRRMVLTGGSAQLPGIKELAHKMMHTQVRLGKPLDSFESRSSYAFSNFSTCTGLLTFALRQTYSKGKSGEMPNSWMRKLTNWLKDNF